MKALIPMAVSVVFLATGCGALKKSTRGNQGGLLDTRAEGGLLSANPRDPSSDIPVAGTHRSLDGEVFGVQLRHKTFDIPVAYNEEVHRWMEYFTGNGRRHFRVYMERMAHFENTIRTKLKLANMPEDLIYLAMIESGFSTSAKSHAGAVGPWQFIRSTGRLYGLESNWWVEERRDPIKSTDAAIGYLSRLHDEFGDWHLACAAYNSGELRIRRAISNLRTRDFWEIARHRKALRRETRDYVPKMIAAAIIAKNADQFGFQRHDPTDKMQDFAEVKIPKAENLRTIARVANIERKLLAELNPELLRCCTPPQKEPYTLRVPRESEQAVIAAIDSGEIGRYADFRRVVIRRGDTLSGIAKRSGVPVEAIVAMNEVRGSRALKPGTELVVPERGSFAPSSGNRVVASYTPPKGKKSMTYVVKKGDTLYTISRRHGVNIDQIRRWNAGTHRKNLRPGHRLKLYVKNDSSENI